MLEKKKLIDAVDSYILYIMFNKIYFTTTTQLQGTHRVCVRCWEVRMGAGAASCPCGHHEPMNTWA